MKIGQIMRQAPSSTQQDELDWRLLKRNEATKTKFSTQELGIKVS